MRKEVIRMGGVIVEISNNQKTKSPNKSIVGFSTISVENTKELSTLSVENTQQFIERLCDGDDIEEHQMYDGWVIDYPLDYDP